MNHPLNNMGYQTLRGQLHSVLRKLETYLDIKIKQHEDQGSVWVLKIWKYGEEDEVVLSRTHAGAVLELKHFLKQLGVEVQGSVEEIESYCSDNEIAYFSINEHIY